MSDEAGNDRYDLERFVRAQDEGDTYARALTELRDGRKRSHWMWFVFPQVAGLGHSPTARHYAISGREEAEAYLEHPVLGPRLVACAELLNEQDVRDAVAVFGSVDAMKLRSSMTLFAAAAHGPEARAFRAVLDRCFDGEDDPETMSRL